MTDTAQQRMWTGPIQNVSLGINEPQHVITNNVAFWQV